MSDSHLELPWGGSRGVAVWVLGKMSVASILAGPEVLSEAELVRAAGIARHSRRCEFIAGRRALRLLLAVHMKEDPSRIKLASACGPAQVGGRSTVRGCSVSHRHGRIAIAVSNVAPIGIDLEHLPSRDVSPALMRLARDASEDRFSVHPLRRLAAWCELEALSKLRRISLFDAVPEWHRLCAAMGLPGAVPGQRSFDDLHFLHSEPFPGWRLVLASGNLDSVRVRVDA